MNMFFEKAPNEIIPNFATCGDLCAFSGEGGSDHIGCNVCGELCAKNCSITCVEACVDVCASNCVDGFFHGV